MGIFCVNCLIIKTVNPHANSGYWIRKAALEWQSETLMRENVCLLNQASHWNEPLWCMLWHAEAWGSGRGTGKSVNLFTNNVSFKSMTTAIKIYEINANLAPSNIIFEINVKMKWKIIFLQIWKISLMLFEFSSCLYVQYFSCCWNKDL